MKGTELSLEQLKESFKQFLLTRDDGKEEWYASDLDVGSSIFADYLCWLTGVEEDWDNTKSFQKELRQGR